MTSAHSPTSGGCPFSKAPRDFDPFDPAFHRDPFPTLQQIRDTEPVYFHAKLGYWIVTKMALAKEVLKDPVHFSADIVLDPIVPLCPSTLENFARSGFAPGGGSLVNDVNPEHDERRKWLSQALNPAKLREFEPFVRQTVTRAVDRFVQRGKADLIGEFAYEIPAVVLLRFLAIPAEDLERVQRWGAPTTLFSWGNSTEADQNHMADMLGEYWAFARSHIERLRQSPGDDVVSLALRGQAEKGLWTDDDLTRMVLNFTFAGHETTTNTAGNAFRLLLSNPQAWQALCDEPSLIPNAVEECIRFSPAVIAHRRRVVEDVEVGGVRLSAGDKVLVYFAAANRDEAVFEEGEQFNIRRQGPNRHVTFGFGWHTCFGAPLARLELRVMLEELTRRLPHMRLAPDQVFSYEPLNIAMRGPQQILTEWDPRANPVASDRASD